MMTRFDANLLNAIPITRVAERIGQTWKRGSRMVALCPWHDDQKPSLTLYDEGKQPHCHCFACNMHGSTIDYVMASLNLDFKEACKWLEDEFHVHSATHAESTYNRFKPKPKEMHLHPKHQYTYIPQDYVNTTISMQSDFCKGLLQVFNPYVVECAVNDYRLGVYENNYGNSDTIFWNINCHQQVCNGKVQGYHSDITKPEFLHSRKGSIYWLGKTLASQGVVPANAVFSSQCLFGEHLLPQWPNSLVCLVESPKNAIIGACFVPDRLWVATGNKGALTCQNLKVLANRDVVVYPDRDAIEEWEIKIKSMRSIANFTVSHFCEKYAPAEESKFDIADYIISTRLQEIHNRSIGMR